MVLGGAGFGATGGAALVPAFLSYKPITSRVMSMVLEANKTGVCGLLTSITST
jgi:hypothetical protein